MKLRWETKYGFFGGTPAKLVERPWSVRMYHLGLSGWERIPQDLWYSDCLVPATLDDLRKYTGIKYLE